MLGISLSRAARELFIMKQNMAIVYVLVVHSHICAEIGYMAGYIRSTWEHTPLGWDYISQEIQYNDVLNELLKFG